MAVMALFAIGFSASDEEEKSNSDSQEQSSEKESNQKDSQAATAQTKEFFEKGHSYKSNKWRLKTAAFENYCVYELTYFNDGSIELIEKETYPNHEYEDWSAKYECRITKYKESKRDIEKQWYAIESLDGKKSLLVDMDGRFYGNHNGKNGYDAVGVQENYQGTLKKQ